MAPVQKVLRVWFAAFWIIAVPSVAASDYTSIGRELERVILGEMEEWQIGGISVALVEDQRVVYANGFGEAKSDSIFRVGSISKLFNAVAVMQQVEAGKLDLDAPLPPDLTPIDPFTNAKPVTLRQLLCHRSGLTREPTVGGYLDDSEPSLGKTVDSVASSVLVTPPGEKVRYSNIGPSVAGRMVERAAGKKFEDYQRVRILDPLGMSDSVWTRARLPKNRLVVSHIRVADGRGGWKHMETPVFDLGTLPAGNLFSTAGDLARFASALLAGGKGILKRETLDEMWRPQLTSDSNGFGLGFMVGNFRGRKTVSHSGAVYGHSTSLVILPNEKIAVIVLGNEDIAGGRMRRISNLALSLMLGEKETNAAPYTVRDLDRFAGEYESQSFWARLEVREGRLVGNIAGQQTKFIPTSELKFTANSRLEDATPVTFRRAEQGNVTGFSMGAQRFQRVPSDRKPLPKEWHSLLGSYGIKLIPIIITERNGTLYAMTENMVDYRLTPINRNVFALPPGMYVDEQLVFLRDGKGRVRGMNYANMYFDKR